MFPKRFLALLGSAAAFLICLLVLPTFAQSSSASISNYRLGPGDVITIQVLGEDDLTRRAIRLSDAATISYPILGEIRLAGKTVGELEHIITEGLRGRYLVNPQVTVSIDEYRRFFINGQVGQPGGYPYAPGLSVLKAITIAGGFRERADQDKIFIVRDSDPEQKRVPADLKTPVYPGDVITVEESFF